MSFTVDAPQSSAYDFNHIPESFEPLSTSTSPITECMLNPLRI